MWFAILVTIFAATGNNIGKALQKEAVHSLPRFSLHPAVFQQYIRSRLWLIGLGADLGGALLMVLAFALAPVSLVQPVSGLGLVSLAIFSHFHLKERLAAEEWGAVGMSMLGTLGLGVSSEDSPAKSPTFGSGASKAAAVLVVLLIGALLYTCRLASYQKRKSLAGARTAASINGLQAGVCFGLSASSCKTGIMLIQQLGWWAFPFGLAGSMLLSSLGFMLQTLGLKDGNTVIVCTCAAVSSMGTGVLVGLLLMGEALPSEFSMKLLRLLSWLVTIAGVSALANGKGGFREIASFAVSLLPRRMEAVLGPVIGVRKSLHSRDLKLPTTETESNV